MLHNAVWTQMAVTKHVYIYLPSFLLPLSFLHSKSLFPSFHPLYYISSSIRTISPFPPLFSSDARNKVGELLGKVSSSKLHAQYAKAREADGQFLLAAKAYEAAKDYDNAAR